MSGLPGFFTSVSTEISSDGEPSCFSVKARIQRVYLVNGSVKYMSTIVDMIQELTKHGYGFQHR